MQVPLNPLLTSYWLYSFGSIGQRKSCDQTQSQGEEITWQGWGPVHHGRGVNNWG